MQTCKASLLCKKELWFSKVAIWHRAWEKFLYVDIEGCKVGCIDPLTRIVKERNVDKRIGIVGPGANGNLIVALEGLIEELNFESGKPMNRCNDGKCDAAGRLWFGTMHKEAKLNEGTLYFDDGFLQKRLDNLSVPNGICWLQDNRIMYHIDSYDYNIKAYDFELKTGNISNERIVVTINEPGHTPDGMCIDQEGMLWVAIWGGGSVQHYNPINGKLIGIVNVDALNVTSCALGGKNMDQIFITTARAGLSDEQLQKYPLSGSLFIAETKIKGLPTNFFLLFQISHYKKLKKDFNEIRAD